MRAGSLAPLGAPMALHAKRATARSVSDKSLLFILSIILWECWLAGFCYPRLRCLLSLSFPLPASIPLTFSPPARPAEIIPPVLWFARITFRPMPHLGTLPSSRPRGCTREAVRPPHLPQTH